MDSPFKDRMRMSRDAVEAFSVSRAPVKTDDQSQDHRESEEDEDEDESE